MKKIVVLFGVMAFFSLLGTAAYAQDTVRLRVDVPFRFTVDNTQLPAGAYDVEYAPSRTAGAFSSVSIRNVNRHLVAFVFMRHLPDQNVQGEALQFTKYGSTYFLSAISNNGCLSVARLGRAVRDMLALRRAQGAAIAVVN
jgi:hypothetical protein